MKNVSDYITEDNKKIWISITGFRTLLILLSLIKKPCTLKKLTEVVQSYEATKKAASKDTIRLSINTLKSFGCEIKRPTKTNKYKYELISHPFHLKLEPDEVDALIVARERFANEIPWKKVILLNNLCKKLISLTENEQYINKIEDTKPLNNIDLTILSELSNEKIMGKRVNLTYKSPKFGFEEIEIVPQKIVYENSNLYLWCHSFKYEKTIVLSVERISRINSVGIEKYNIKPDFYEVEYEVFGSAKRTFKPTEEEEIINETSNSLKVRAKVNNEFWFIQRLLLFGSEFKVISPHFFREKLINKIKLIRKGYTE